MTLLLLLFFGCSLSGCIFIAATAAGAGAGYIYKEQQEKGKVP